MGNSESTIGFTLLCNKSRFKKPKSCCTSDFAWKTDLTNLKSDVDKVNIDKLKNVSSNFSNLKNKVDKLDIDKLVPVPVDLSNISYVAKIMLLKKINISLRSKILKIKYLILLT